MGNEDGFVVGVVACNNPHSNFHVKTLEELDEVEAVYLCGLEGEDLDSIAADTSKMAGTMPAPSRRWSPTPTSTRW